MFQVIRQLQLKEGKKILVHTENGVTASEKKQIETVTNHFKEVFQRRGEDEIKDIEPTEMKRPFTELEIRKSVSRLKNIKSTGIHLGPGFLDWSFQDFATIKKFHFVQFFSH